MENHWHIYHDFYYYIKPLFNTHPLPVQSAQYTLSFYCALSSFPEETHVSHKHLKAFLQYIYRLFFSLGFVSLCFFWVIWRDWVLSARICCSSVGTDHCCGNLAHFLYVFVYVFWISGTQLCFHWWHAQSKWHITTPPPYLFPGSSLFASNLCWFENTGNKSWAIPVTYLN